MMYDLSIFIYFPRSSLRTNKQTHKQTHKHTHTQTNRHRSLINIEGLVFHPSPVTAAVILFPVITHSCSPSQFPIPVPRFPSPFLFPIPVPRTRSPFLVPVLFQVPILLKVSPSLSINYNINHVSAPSIFFFDLDSRKSTGFARRCITTYNNYA